LAGFGAGVAESALAVTPFESIKTQLIDDRKRAQPRMRGLIHGSALIAREQGTRGIFQGFVPTTARQAANSAVRFSSYNTIKGYIETSPGLGQNRQLGSISHFAIGAVAGIITVFVLPGPVIVPLTDVFDQIHNGAPGCGENTHAKPGRPQGLRKQLEMCEVDLSD
jgi:hypothetical protein